MAFDIVLQRFEDGEATAFGADTLLDPLRTGISHADEHGATFAIDSFGGDVYGLPREGESTESLMVSHTTEGVERLLFDLLSRGDLSILAPGVPPLVSNETNRRELPKELQSEAEIVRSAADVARLLFP